MSRRQTVLLLCLFLPLVAGGCHSLPRWLRKDRGELPPEAFTDTPELEDVIYVVNANTQRVQQLQTENATLRVEGIPALRANLAYEQPRNFRLRAQLSQFTGRELDMGSNRDLFWFWVRRDEQPSVYFARHDEFATSPARDLVPIEPHRLIDALGLIYLDPQGRHQGPSLREPNLLEIRSRIPSPRGDMSRVLLLDARYGWMVEQHFYDASGQLLLSARASRHQYYPDDAVTMPHHIEVSLLPGQPAQMAFDVDVSRYIFNRLSGEPEELWTLPVIDGYPSVNIADPQFRPPVAAIPRDPRRGPLQYGPAIPRDPFGRDPNGPYGPTTPGGDPSSVYGLPRSAQLPAYRGYNSALR